MALKTFRSRFIYSFADRVWGFVENVEGIGNDVRFDFFADPAKVFKPQRTTLLHDLVRNLISFDFDDSTGDWAADEIDTYEALLSDAGMPWPAWLNENKVEDHIRELDTLLAQAINRIVPSVFFILYSDREFLSEFQALVSEYVRTLRREDHEGYLRKDGVVKRVSYLPAWLRDAVFYRDKGHCQICWRNLTGLAIPVRDRELDHIVPLASSGSNDPTNFQLVCRKCNRAKGSKSATTMPRFVAYW